MPAKSGNIAYTVSCTLLDISYSIAARMICGTVVNKIISFCLCMYVQNIKIK